MCFKLALRNVRRGVRDYGVYFLTLTIGVCVFYMFNSIDGQRAVMDLTDGQSAAIALLGGVMSGVSALVSAVLGFLILYANSFLMRKRKREFGLYALLGMEKSRVSRVLMFETATVGAVSLAAGLPLGILLSQGMALVTARLIEACVGAPRFVFSPAALWKTIAYFGLAFLIALVFNVVSVRRHKLITLLNAARKNENLQASRTVATALIFAVSAGLTGYAYYLALSGAILVSPNTLLASVSLGALGTFLMMRSLSGFLLDLTRLRRGLYLRGLNMFVLRQLCGRIRTSYISASFVCLMLFVSICTLSSGMGLARAIAVRLRSNTPFDATLALHHSGAAPGEEILEAKLRAGGVDIGAFAREYRGARYYDAGVDISLMVQGKAAAIRAPFIALSDFNALLSMQGAEPVNLGGGEFAINSAVTGGAWPAALSRYVADGADILAGGARLVTDPSRLYNYPLSVSQNTTSYFEIVVPDYALRGAGVILETLNMNYRDGGDDYERACRAALSGVRVATAAGVAQETFLTTKTQVYETSGASTAVIAYISVYLGVVFLLACVTVLAIGGLSRAGQDAARYALLRKLGADEDMINRALFWQTLAHFGAPMLPAAAHSAVGIALASRLVSSFGSMNILSSCLIAALFIAGIYGGYFVVAYISGKTLTSSA